MHQRFAGTEGSSPLLERVRCGIILVAVGFACTACSRQESSAQQKAASSSPQRDARVYGGAPDPLEIVQDNSHSRDVSADEHVFYPTAGSEIEPPDLPGTVQINVPPALLRLSGQSPWQGYALTGDLGSSGITSQLSPTDETPAATVAPLPSAFWAGLALLCGVGLASTIQFRRVRYRAPHDTR